MVIFNWWEALPIMKGGWRCASMIPGEQCVMIFGVVLMLLWSAGSWDMPTLDVSLPYCCTSYRWNNSDVKFLLSQWSDAGISCRQLDYHRTGNESEILSHNKIHCFTCNFFYPSYMRISYLKIGQSWWTPYV